MATEAQKFVADHGYVKGTYEAKAQAQGYNLADIKAQGFSWGNNMNPGEYQELISQFKSPIQLQQEQAQARQNQIQQGLQAQGGQIQQGLQDLSGQKFQFDTQGAIASAQQEASSIYSPQQAQLEAIRQLQSSQAQEQRLQTEEQFDQQLQQEIEMINARGAYFSGGAIDREQEIGDLEARTLRQLDLQSSAANFGNLAQQAMLSAQEAMYVKDRVFNDRSSAYNVFLQERGFQFDVLQTQYQQYQDERNFARSVFESDRGFRQGVFESDRAFDQSVSEFQAQYDLSMEQFQLSKEKFQEDIKQYNESVAWEKFKYNNRSTGEESYSTSEIRQFAKDKKEEGYNWHQINELAKEEGIPNYGDSELDNQLWREFEGRENPLYDGRVGDVDNWEAELEGMFN